VTREPLPTEPWKLAELILPLVGPQLGELYDRFTAQIGDENASDRIWDQALADADHQRAHEQAHEDINGAIEAAQAAMVTALFRLDTLNGMGYCTEIAESCDGEDIRSVLEAASRSLRIAGKLLALADDSPVREHEDGSGS
jgi:hypothetical protein